MFKLIPYCHNDPDTSVFLKEINATYNTCYILSPSPRHEHEELPHDAIAHHGSDQTRLEKTVLRVKGEVKGDGRNEDESETRVGPLSVRFITQLLLLHWSSNVFKVDFHCYKDQGRKEGDIEEGVIDSSFVMSYGMVEIVLNETVWEEEGDGSEVRF